MPLPKFSIPLPNIHHHTYTIIKLNIKFSIKHTPNKKTNKLLISLLESNKTNNNTPTQQNQHAITHACKVQTKPINNIL